MKLFLKNGCYEKESPLIMGILNVTPDSFSDGGRYFSLEEALRHAGTMISQGAEIIDVGGESTRPGAENVSEEEELERVIPVISAIKKRHDVLVSIDTSKSGVARSAVLEGGADIVNDISALKFSADMAETVARLEVPVVLMHIKGTPGTMQLNPSYEDVISEIIEYFAERIEFAESQNIRREKIIIDVGIGFGKRFEDNICLIKNMGEFRKFQLPLLAGVSRKRFISVFSQIDDPEERDLESALISAWLAQRGADILRVHNVRYTKRALRTLGILSGKRRNM